jgi:hypothetical protein
MSNVYYLAPPAPPAERARPSGDLPLRLRLLTFWWRLRLTTTEVLDTLRRFGRSPIDNDTAFLEQQADMILALPRPSAGPARIIDFAAARTRLRA